MSNFAIEIPESLIRDALQSSTRSNREISEAVAGLIRRQAAMLIESGDLKAMIQAELLAHAKSRVGELVESAIDRHVRKVLKAARVEGLFDAKT